MRRLGTICLLLALLACRVAYGGVVGCRHNTASDVTSGIKGVITMAVGTASENGIVDSLGFVCTAGTGDSPARMALYKWSSPSPPPCSLKDTTAGFVISEGDVRVFYSMPSLRAANIYSGQNYGITIWAGGLQSPVAIGTSTDTICTDNGAVKTLGQFTKTYGVWPDTINVGTTAWYLYGYLDYHTTAASGTAGRRKKIIISSLGQRTEDLGPYIVPSSGIEPETAVAR